MKNNKKKFLISSIIFTVITILSVIMIGNYERIYKMASEDEYYNDGYEYIQSDLYLSSLVLNKFLKEKESGNIINYNEIYNIEESNSHEEIDGIIEDTNYDEETEVLNDLIDAEDNLIYGYKNLEYYAINNETNTSITNSDNDLSLLINSEENNELSSYYRYYVVISYDKDGNSKVLNTNKDTYNQSEYNNQKYIVVDENYKLENPKNMTVVYSIAKDLKYTDDVIYYKSMSIDSYKIGVIMLKYIAISFLIMMILGLVISYKSVDEDFILGRILNWPFEILSFLMICGAISLLINPEFVRYSLNNTEIVEAFSKYDISENFIKYGINILNIVYWMLIFIAIFGAMQLIKYIFGKGIINYIKENTLTGRLVIHLINKAKEIFENISRIDLKEEGNKYIFKVVLINFVIVSIFCAFWFTGILGTIIYSVILFYVLRKYMNELRCKYEILLEATNKIAEGNLDVEITEDLKVFEPVKKELKKIQSGFKKAVEEEVKSQNMKTELITNVSHDLKTPLTSIITYVDLLKDDNIKEEDRKLYIETLDKKSQRLKVLIEDLFEVSKASSKDVKLDIIDLDIIELIKQVEVEFKSELDSKNINIKWINENEKIILPLDSQKTFRIFENLIGNISKYSMKNSRVYI